MLAADYFHYGLESIDHQTDGLLMSDITTFITEVTEAKKRDFNEVSAKVEKKIEKVVLDRTGLNINFEFKRCGYINAYVIPPQIDRNHPLLTDFHRAMYESDGIRKVKDKKTVLSGSVDKKKAKVSGVFSDISVKVVITRELLTSGIFSPDEMAAILIHELGHVFTYYEYLGFGMTTNYILHQASRELSSTNEHKRRVQIVKEGSKALGIDLDDPDMLVASQNDVVIQTVILRKAMEKRTSELNSGTYDLTAWEMMSDQFVARHGGGRSLVTGLDKLFRFSGDNAYSGSFAYHAMEVVKLLFIIVATNILAPLVLITLLMFVDTNEDLYDTAKARMERVKRDMQSSLKDRSLSKEVVNKTTEDLEVIENILSEMVERRTYLQFFWSTLRKKGRHNYQQTKFQQELEIMVNNEIFTRAAKLRTIKL